jgi:membrane-bound ClpP family serine protease
MLAATANRAPASASAPRGIRLLGLALLAGLLGPVPTRAGAPPEDGLFVTVASPITDSVMYQVRNITDRNLSRADRPVRTFVYDFNPGGNPSSSDQYGSCRDLAEYLLRLRRDRRATTVAFVHNKVSRHTLLPVLACEHLVLSPEARLGNEPGEVREPLARDQVEFYREVATEGRHCSPAIVLKMFNRDLEVFEGWRNGSTNYFEKPSDGPGPGAPILLRLHPALPPLYLEQPGRPPDGVLVKGPVPQLAAGKTALYTPQDARIFGLRPDFRKTRTEVALLYGLNPASLREDPLQGRVPVAVHLELKGAVTEEAVKVLKRRIRRAVGPGRRANVIVLQLECGGGDPEAALDLAQFLHTLKDDAGQLPVLSVAFVPERAPDTATFVALGCTEIILRRDAWLGDFESLIYERQGNQLVEVKPEQYRTLREVLLALADEQGYPPAIIEALFDPHRTVRWEDLGGRPGRQGVIQEGGPNGRPLKLNAELARGVGLARHVVDGLPDLYAYYGIEPDAVTTADSDWLEEVGWFLRQPWMDAILVLLGITCLILEVKMPGVGLPGVLAAVCFVLFFWAHSQFAGRMTILAVLLFALGLLLVGLEIFVIPGFGVTGISGVVLVLFSLAIVTLEKKPETTAEWLGFGRTLLTFGGCLLGAMGLAYVLASYLPHLPYAHRLILVPPAEKAAVLGEEPALPPAADAALLGAVGVAMTALRPAGMVRVGDEFLDVVAEGDYINPGARVQVVEIEGKRIVVKLMA